MQDYSHGSNPAKIEVKQEVTGASSKLTKSSHALQVIMQEKQARLSQEVVAEISSCSPIQRMIQRIRNFNLMGLLAAHGKACPF